MNMSCNDIASILDTHRSARLAPAERSRVDAHLAACTDCTAAWNAQSELLALRVPPVPATLLERALLASRLPQSATPRRARLPIVIGSVLLAGAALAAVTAVTVGSWNGSDDAVPATMTAGEAPAAGVEGELQQLQDAARSAARAAQPISVELVETALSVQPIVRHAPDYPPDALERGLEGHVQVKFDVTAAGVVENVSVVESSDSQFEDSAVRAVSGWRYLPRIAAGKRVGSQGIHTIIRFALNKDPAPVAVRAIRPDPHYVAFNVGLEVAMDRLAADDLRGVELQLDEMQALYGADRADLWSFYGYLYTVQGNYDRAIDAYERSVAIYLRGQPRSGPWVALANLYFARHQYDIALKTLLRPREATNGAAPLGGTSLLGSEAEALIERLRALGVTEETL
jgi:TonB family protein